MGETTPPSRMGLRHSGGEIVEVQGGHIVRSTGRKDRHSKVCTAKGPRDRRVRLSAHTAIQFYDVQDRLGYDRPSKAVDWLIKKAKAAIDELEELPAWTPTSGWAAANSNSNSEPILPGSSSGRRGTTSTTAAMLVVGDDVMEMGNHSHNNPPNCENNNDNSSSFLPQSMDSDAIADTIKSFFPMGGSAAVAVGSTNSSPMQFQGFPPPDLRQDLRLSLQSFDDQILFHHHNQPPPPQQQQQSATHQTDLFGGIGFDAPSAAGWPEHQRMVAWNAGGDGGGGGGGGGGFVFNSPPLLQPFLFSQNNNQFVSQRGPLQSSNTQSIRAWIDHPSSFSAATASVDHHHYHHHQNLPVYPSPLGGFSGFRIPARIQGEEEEHDGISDKPSSASSDSRH